MSSPPLSSAAPRLTGTVTAAFGRRYRIETPSATLDCVTRGKRSEAACGDAVEVTVTSAGQGVIERVLPRRSVFLRSDRFRTKIVAANVTQLLLVIAPRPSFADELVNRCLVAAEAETLTSIIVVNKADLADLLPATLARTRAWARAGYPVVPISAKTEAEVLLPYLRGHTTVLVGQSGMGKSTLMNALIPGAARRVAEISEALDSGKHTTTHSVLHPLDDTSRLVDSPGLQEFGLAHLTRGQLENAFPEFRPFLGKCRFRDCRHGPEPGCAIVDAMFHHHIPAERLEAYRSLVQETRP